jgi:hypothetical protein
MLVPFEFKVDEPEFRRLLLKHFPEVSEEIEDDEGLVHLEMASLERLANCCIKSGDLNYLKRIYEFVGDLGRHQSEVDPDVINAIHVSFLEGLNFENKKNGEKAKTMLPPVLLRMWEAQMEHNRKIGWLK